MVASLTLAEEAHVVRLGEAIVADVEGLYGNDERLSLMFLLKYIPAPSFEGLDLHLPRIQAPV
ncbi:hypothetical protein JMJ77_0004909 [Colletotrichum scovillei]|uniref:Uncharacterized protein n=1 Tax=Colletotrichum scovillei TaxID=1209932 RepID=A0A9P7RHB0_9PEZI|nr:hypothetical protein JMJ77_0004909 [Colletotrichum scovillei]KAG7076085.1 hypothetical protein JMJ76_0013356 [Colletotrichum scovillei]KAG7083220.1 hypothetical protein JMJ78_0008669 [Colletotrichum scovillei]